MGAGLVAGAVCTAMAAALVGASGAWGAMVGAVLVVGFFGSGQVVLRVARDVPPALLLLVAVLTYTLQAVALLALYAAFARRPAWNELISTDALGVTALVCTLTWTTALVLAARNSRMPVYDADGSGR